MIEVRNGRKEDCRSLLESIRELSVYMKLFHLFKLDVETLERDGFGDKPCFYSILAFDADKIVGHCVYYFGYSTFSGKTVYMEDLFVFESYRGKGIGTRLWKSLIQVALENNCTNCDFSVTNWNTSSIAYYKSKGAVNKTKTEDWHCFQLTLEAMKKLVNEENSIQLK